MEEFLENLLYSATFPAMDKWRRFSAAPEPAECVMRVFVRMELRLQHRYGLVELERLVETRRAHIEIWNKIQGADMPRLWAFLKHVNDHPYDEVTS